MKMKTTIALFLSGFSENYMSYTSRLERIYMHKPMGFYAGVVVTRARLISKRLLRVEFLVKEQE